MDIKDPRLLKLKGMLFLAIGLATAALLFFDSPSLRTVVLLAVCVWAFCRFYYFAFYVLQRYADTSFKYTGLTDLCLYLLGKKGGRPRVDSEEDGQPKQGSDAACHDNAAK